MYFGCEFNIEISLFVVLRMRGLCLEQYGNSQDCTDKVPFWTEWTEQNVIKYVLLSQKQPAEEFLSVSGWFSLKDTRFFPVCVSMKYEQ